MFGKQEDEANGMRLYQCFAGCARVALTGAGEEETRQFQLFAGYGDVSPTGGHLRRI